MDAGEIRPARQHLRGVVWAAPREDENHDQIGKGKDNSKEQGDDAHRRDERQRDAKKMEPESGAVDRGGVVNVLRNG